MRILSINGFYGLLLMHMNFAIDATCETAATDGLKIYFAPKFMDELSDSELDFVLMHEILHIVLQHVRRKGDRDHELFNIACDIVVNSNILLSNSMRLTSITLKNYGESMHLAPDGKEGYEYTSEQVYEMLSNSAAAYDVDDSGADKDDAKNKSKNNNVSDRNTDDDSAEGAIGKESQQNKGNCNGGTSEKEGNGDEDTDGIRSDGGIELGRALHRRAKRKNSAAKSTWDDHTKWGMYEEDSTLRDVWVKRFVDACEAISVSDPSNSRGRMPMFAQRLLRELRRPQTDWRTILNDFVQEEVVDYTFTPPDRRFDDSGFFLPDFNGKEDKVENILFMIDTSASMSDEMISAAYSEIKGAIDQFDGRLKGWLGFFDAAIIEPTPFDGEDEFKIIKPAGGGGTDFQIIFEYVAKYMAEKLPASIIILTDGYAPFPKPKLAMGIPVLWLLNNDEVDPPWGKVARIKV